MSNVNFITGDTIKAFSLTSEQVVQLRRVFLGFTPEGYWELENYDQDYPDTCNWLKQCYHWPSVQEVKLAMLNELIGGFGVEAIFTDGDMMEPALSYVNMGDTYAATIAYDHREDEFILTSYGDWVEAYEQETGETIP